MSVETTEFVRKTFGVEAIRVTAHNMLDIAEWCNGKIENTDPNKYSGKEVCIKVAVKKASTVRQTMAFEGDWVLRLKGIPANRGFKVYTDKAFNNTFENRSGKLF